MKLLKRSEKKEIIDELKEKNPQVPEFVIKALFNYSYMYCITKFGVDKIISELSWRLAYRKYKKEWDEIFKSFAKTRQEFKKQMQENK